MGEEKHFENKIKKFLEAQDCWFVKFFGNGFTKAGTPDLLVCCNSYFLAVEVKASKGKPSELQLYNIQKIRASGGFAVVVYPEDYDDLVQLIYLLRNNKLDEVREIERRLTSAS